MNARLFESPEWLPWVGIAVAVVAAALAARAWRDARRRRALLGAGGLLTALAPDAALVAAVGVIAIALCGPLLGERRVRVDDRGMDIVLLVDASRSMDARDTPPSRLRRAKQTAAELVAALPPADRVGLVAFAGTGRTLAPLTPDRDVLVRLLERIDSRTAPPRGSSLEAGLATAFEVFELDAERRRAIVLLSDGELPRDGPSDIARLGERHGVHVYAALFGRELGATIPDHGVPVIGPDGEPALTRREPARATMLAAETGGEVFLADRWGRVSIDDLARALRGDLGTGDSNAAFGELGAEDATSVFETRRVPMTVPFAFAAFVLLLAEGPLRRRVATRAATRRSSHHASRAAFLAPRKRHGVVSVAIAALLASLGAAGPGAHSREQALPDLAPSLLRAGAQATRLGDDDAALEAFRGAAATALRPDLAGTAYYQIGVWHLKHDDPLAARDAFFESLRLDPNRVDAVFNLEWSLLSIEAQRASEEDAQPPLAPDAPATDEVRDETSQPREPEDDPVSPEFARGQTPERRPSGQVRPMHDGIPTPGPNREAGADARPLPDDEALSWWLEAIEDDPSRAQVPDRGRGRGPKPSGPPW